MATNNPKQDAIDNFYSVTNYNLSQYFVVVELFLTVHYKNIVDWYSGASMSPNSDSFRFLDLLLSETSVVLTQFDQNKNNFQNYIYWELIEAVDDINVRLLTAKNLPKFLRSSITNNKFSSTYETDYIIGKGETLENIQKNQINNTDPENDWINVAIRNDLSESEYDIEGGQSIKIPLNLSLSLNLQSVIDSGLIGEKTYGKDLNKKITFVDNDLDVLSYQDTVIQSALVKSELQQGDIPEFPYIGIDPSMTIGSNLAAFRSSSVIRQLRDTYSIDDTFATLTIDKFTIEQDAVILEYSVSTVNGETLSYTKTI